MITQIWRRLNRLGYGNRDLLEVCDLLLDRYNIYVEIYPQKEGGGLFTYGVLDLDLGRDARVDQEMRSFTSYRIALENGILEALAYVQFQKDAGIVVAIDGYPACGKSTIAKRLAKDTGYTYIDTGAMYRAAALYFDKSGKPINEENVKGINITFRKDTNKDQHIILNGQDVEYEIRSLRISKLASEIGIVPCVQEYIGNIQRELGRVGGVIMDGRDVGTVVLPDAQLKLFLSADIGVRASRRLKDLGEGTTLEDVLKDLKDRDWRDIDQFNGSRKAKDAIELDTTELTEDEQFKRVKELFIEAVKKYRLG